MHPNISRDIIFISYCNKFFRTRPERLWGPPSLLYSEYRVFPPVVKRPELGFDHPPQSCTKINLLKPNDIYIYVYKYVVPQR